VTAPLELRETRTTCPYCGTGCGVLVQSAAGRIVGVRGDPDHPANFGKLCSKGLALPSTTAPEARLLHPELRIRRAAQRLRCDWDEALDLAAERFARAIAEHGPDSVAFFVSGQLLTEDYYVFNKLARGLVGTNNIDSNSRLCMSSAVAGYKRSLGADAPPTCYDDLERADCVFIAGANPAFAHPVLYGRLREARARDAGIKLVVVDPRRTDTAAEADLHLAIRPGTDVALFNGMLHAMLSEGWIDRAFVDRHTEGFDELAALVADYSPARAAAMCGVERADLVRAAAWFARSAATLSLYCQGLNQSSHGTDKNTALINLHLATGQIGRPGAGPFSLTGQPNAMGGREVGAMATLLSAHRDLADPAQRDEVARLWGIEALSGRAGLSAVEMFEAARAGRIKALWIACTNPAQSMPDRTRVVESLLATEFVVVQEAFRGTETAAYADLLLPASTWGEKDGTVTNSERRISRVRGAVAPPGEARHDWAIAAEFGRRLARRLGRDGDRLFPYASPEAIFDEHRATTKGRDLDIGGLEYGLLDTLGPQQWPYPERAVGGTARLYADGRFATASGRARFVAAPCLPTAEDVAADYPLRLTTGRLRDQWHGMSRTGTSGRSFGHEGEPVLCLDAADMARLGLADGDLASVASRRASLVIRVRSEPGVGPGLAYLPMHWGGRFLSGGGVNALTLAAVDPHSRQPELKHAAVRVARCDWRWEVAALRVGDVHGHLERLAPLMDRFPHATCALYGRERSMVVFRAAAPEAVDAALIEALDAALALDGPEKAIDYADRRRGNFRRAVIVDGVLVGARLCGNTAAFDRLKELAAQGLPVDAWGARLLAPSDPGLEPAATGGRLVCNCVGVSERAIRACAAQTGDFDTLQRKLGCGTGCGSCIPEVRRLMRATTPAAAG
jgi:assimilatory nitrate reductase catalytic subunit